MSLVSKLTFVPFTPDYPDSTPHVYQSGRDRYRGELCGGLNGAFATAAGIAGMCLPYSKEKYARIVVWCLHLLWPAHIPFTNLSDIDGGTASLHLLTDLLRDGTLKFIPAPLGVCQRALHDPESVLPHVMAAAKLSPLPRTIPVLKLSLSRFSDLIAPRGQLTPLACQQPASERVHPPALTPASAEERVLDPHMYTLEPILTTPLGPDSTSQPHERRQRCDVNKARHRPVSNPEGKPMRARKIGALTSSYVLDPPARPGSGRDRMLKPLSELRLPVMVSDHLGGYSTSGKEPEDVDADEIESFSDSARPSPGQGQVLKPLSELRLPVTASDHLDGYAALGRDNEEADEIESFSDSEDESEQQNRAKRRRCV